MIEVAIDLDYVTLKDVKGHMGFFTGFVTEIKPETLYKASQFPFCFKLDGAEYIDITMQVTPMENEGKSYVQFMINRELWHPPADGLEKHISLVFVVG